MDSLNLYSKIRRENETVLHICEMTSLGMSAEFISGYETGYAEAIRRVLETIKGDAKEPPKASGHPDWNRIIQDSMRAAPSCVQKDENGEPYVS